jgi:hypothetical protein
VSSLNMCLVLDLLRAVLSSSLKRMQTQGLIAAAGLDHERCKNLRGW